MRRALRLWPVVAVLTAVALALLAHGVLVAADGARAGRTPGRLARVGEALTGTRSSRELRQALVLVAVAEPPGPTSGLAFHRRTLAEAALARCARHGSPAERAQAANVLAALLVADAAFDRAHAARYFADAEVALESAVLLDPGDEDSKFDLELLLAIRGDVQSRDPGGPDPHGRRAVAAGGGDGY